MPINAAAAAKVSFKIFGMVGRLAALFCHSRKKKLGDLFRIIRLFFTKLKQANAPNYLFLLVSDVRFF